MNYTEILRRLDLLQAVIASSRGLGYFNVWQIMCLHKERSALYTAIEELSNTGEEAASPEYQIPAHLEKRLEHVKQDFNL